MESKSEGKVFISEIIYRVVYADSVFRQAVFQCQFTDKRKRFVER